MATLSLRWLAHRALESLANRRLRRKLTRTPRTRIGELAEDTMGRVVGTARPLDKRVLEAPLSGRLCFYYAIEIDALRAKQYRVLSSYHDAIAFVLDDRGDSAIVDPIQAEVSCAFDHVVRVTTSNPPTHRALEILARRGIHEDGLRFFSELRIREAIIEVDEAIAVLGAGTREPDGGRADGYREHATRLYLAGSPRFPLTISDDPSA